MLHVFSYQHNSLERYIYIYICPSVSYHRLSCKQACVALELQASWLWGRSTGPSHNRGTHNHCLLHSHLLPVGLIASGIQQRETRLRIKHVSLHDTRQRCKLLRRRSSCRNIRGSSRAARAPNLARSVPPSRPPRVSSPPPSWSHRRTRKTRRKQPSGPVLDVNRRLEEQRRRFFHLKETNLLVIGSLLGDPRGGKIDLPPPQI